MSDFFHPSRTFDEIQAEFERGGIASVTTAHADRALHFFRKHGDRPALEITLEVDDAEEDVADWRESELYRQLPFLLAINAARREVLSTRQATAEITTAAANVVRSRRPERSVGVPDDGPVPAVDRARRR